jgi:hypothetical protein
MRITEDMGVKAETGMRAQQFPVSVAEALDDVVIIDLHHRLERVIAGLDSAVPMGEILQRLTKLRESHECRFAVNDGVP